MVGTNEEFTRLIGALRAGEGDTDASVEKLKKQALKIQAAQAAGTVVGTGVGFLLQGWALMLAAGAGWHELHTDWIYPISYWAAVAMALAMSVFKPQKKE